MQPGKLPAELLSRLLASVPQRDPRVLLGPGIGRDAAVIDTGGPRLLVAKTDPITFASDLIGWYAVNVNANDIACLGATPCWFMATMLLPDGAEASLAEAIFAQVADACSALNIALVGGHTEITLGLTRPIVVGAMLGEVERECLVRPDGARPGDALLLAGGIAVEGTAVLAREAPGKLRSLGVSMRTIDEAARYLTDPGISVVAAARAACAAASVHAMHDPTEGGLATALYEMAEAGNLRIVVDPETIAVLPATRVICEAARLDPLGLLASGALLIAVDAGDGDAVIAALRANGVEAASIGHLEAGKPRVIMSSSGRRSAAPRFARDEVARFLARQEP